VDKISLPGGGGANVKFAAESGISLSKGAENLKRLRLKFLHKIKLDPLFHQSETNFFPFFWVGHSFPTNKELTQLFSVKQKGFFDILNTFLKKKNSHLFSSNGVSPL